MESEARSEGGESLFDDCQRQRKKKTIGPFSTATSTSQNLFSKKKKYKQTVLPPPRGVRLRGSGGGGDRGRRWGALRPLCRDHRGDGDGGKEEEEEKS